MSLSERRNFKLKFIFGEASTSKDKDHSPPSKRSKTDEKVEEIVQKVKVEEEENADPGEENRQRWPHVREKFFLYTPGEVSAINNIDVLHRVQDLYRPSAQPHTEEEFEYCDLVAKAKDARLLQLKCE